MTSTFLQSSKHILIEVIHSSFDSYQNDPAYVYAKRGVLICKNATLSELADYLIVKNSITGMVSHKNVTVTS